jgi:pimeloyl-ACP methyl ester carboxylesterase
VSYEGRPERFEHGRATALVYRYGASEGTPFVLVHGIGVGLSYFRRLAPLLAEHGQVHVLELPGFGNAPEPPHVLSVEEHGPVVLVGQSMGGQVVLDTALRVPELVQRLVAIGAVTDPDERSALMQGLRLLQDTVGETPAANWEVFSEYLKCGPRRYLATLPSMLAYDTDAAAASVAVPTMLIRGEKDPICRRPWARRLAARLAIGGLIEIPGGRHNCHTTHPRAVASAILTAVLEPRA